MDFLEALVDPFGADQPARVPDIERLNSVCFRDALEIAAPTNTFDGTSINGVVLFISYGYTQMQNQFCGSSVGQSLYHFGIAGIDANGNPVLNTGLYDAAVSMNYTNIVGIGADGTFNFDDSLAQSMRLVAAGLRILPAIEVVTDTTVPYNSYYISGQLTGTELFEWFNASGYDIRTLLKNSPYSEVYGNNDGTCNRYDPIQKDGLFETRSLINVRTAPHSRDDVRMPCVVIQFSEPINSTEALPFIVHVQWWLECTLRQPTPIYASPSPVDPNFEHVLSVLSQSDDIYPIVTKGHSFGTFSQRFPAFLRNASDIMRTSASFLRSSERFITGISTRRRKKRAKKRKRKRKPKKSSGRIGNAPPSASMRPVRNS
jgi:hypothetical protein